MATNIEIEAKVLITENEYEKLISGMADKIAREFDQINYFIETDNFDLRKLGVGLRVRNVGGEYIMNLKAPMHEGLLEKRVNISIQEYRALKNKGIFPENDITEFMRMLGFDISSLKVVTVLKTHRIEINHTDDDYMLSIDENEYNGIVDYELEMSGTSIAKAQKHLQNICKEYGIEYKDNPRSKATRAFDTLEKK